MLLVQFMNETPVSTHINTLTVMLLKSKKFPFMKTALKQQED